MNTEPIYGLVCAGGGAHGAYQVGVLRYVHENFCTAGRSPFQIFAGASCGSLNTTFYAAESYQAEAARLRLEELWLGFHVPAYHGNTLKNAAVSLYKNWRKPASQRSLGWALLDPDPMIAVLQKGFQRSNLLKAFEKKSTLGVAVAATEILSGRACWFQEGPWTNEWNLFHSIGIHDQIEWQHLAASCSVPVFLPPVKIKEHYFLDGSVSLDKPLSAAIIMGASHILSIATDKPHPIELPKYARDFKPRLSNVIRLLLNRLGGDAAGNEAAEIKTFNRFYEALSRKNKKNKKGDFSPLPLFHDEAKPAHYHHTEILRIIPSRRIRNSGSGDSSDGQTRRRTRFMFHESFIREMIDLGYTDAKNQHQALAAFFSTPRKGRLSFLKKFKKAG